MKIQEANQQSALEKNNLGHYLFHLAAKNTGPQTAKDMMKLLEANPQSALEKVLTLRTLDLKQLKS